MEELGKKIAETIIEQSAKTIGLYPGGFKPSHRGHFEVAKRAAQHVDELHIIISNNIREGYTPEVSLKVWKQYLPLLPENVKVKIAISNSPITEIYNIVKDKTNNYLVIFGKGEKDRYNSINENREKYSNVDIIDAGNFDDISATSLREAIRTRNKLAIKSLIPEGIKVDDFLMNFQIHEIKVNTPGLYFPLKAQNIKEAARIVDELIRQDYRWMDGSKLNLRDFGDNYSLVLKYNIINPEDKKISYGFELAEEKIPGGLASGLTLQDIADKHKANISSLRKQLQKGIKVEMEHTTSKDVAEEIAMDHLFEDPKYYDKLSSIEEGKDYHALLVAMAKRKDPDRLTSLGKDYLPEPKLDEAKQVGDVYHFTNLNGLENILKTNKFKGSTTEVDKFNPDFRSFRKKESDYKDKGIGDVNYFSTTRNKDFWKKDPKIGGSLARIKLDGNKLSNTYKIHPFSYYSDEMTSDANSKYEQDESEERINLDTKTEIPNAQNYIKEIDMFLDKLGDNMRVLNLIKDLQTKYPQIKTFYKDKELSVDQYISDILPTIEPYHEVDEIKVNKPGQLNFPLHIETPEDAQKIGKELLKQGYTWDDGKIDIYNAPFKTNHFEPFILNKIWLNKPEDKTISLGFGGGDEELFESKLLKEVFSKQHAPILDKAVKWGCEYLDVPRPNIILINNPEYTKEHHSFGGYSPSDKSIKVVVYNRNLADLTRSLFHEMVHLKQDEEGRLTPESGKDGDEWENEANSTAGTMMRKFSRENPEIFE